MSEKEVSLAHDVLNDADVPANANLGARIKALRDQRYAAEIVIQTMWSVLGTELAVSYCPEWMVPKMVCLFQNRLDAMEKE